MRRRADQQRLLGRRLNLQRGIELRRWRRDHLHLLNKLLLLADNGIPLLLSLGFDGCSCRIAVRHDIGAVRVVVVRSNEGWGV